VHKIRSEILSNAPRPSPVAAKTRKPAALGASLAAIPVKRTESRTTNQREGDRVPGVLASTTLTLRRRKLDARVVNLSADGVMVEVDADARIGDRVTMTFGKGDAGTAIVRWIRDGRIGMEFDGYSLELGRNEDGSFAFRRNTGGRRKTTERAPRHSLVWRAHVHAGHQSIPVKLANVSASGASIEGEMDLPVGASVLLDFASVGMLPSTVRWCEGNRAGLSFDRHFDVSLLSICSVSEQSIRKIDWVKPEYLADENDPDSPHRNWEKMSPSDLAFFR